MNYSALLLVALSCLSCIIAEVVVLNQVQVIYDKSPKLRIRGSGFDVDDHDITLTLGAIGAAPLVVDKDFLINVDQYGDGLILRLLSNRRWVDLAGRSPPVALILKAVKFKGNDANQLLEEVIVARVLAIPTIQSNDDYVLYQTMSNELRVNGTGFLGAKKVDLYFDPPLVKEVAYEDVSKYPLTTNEVVLRLRHGYTWRKTPGPLVVLGVDTGGGPMKVAGEDGIVVANVQADLDERQVRVEDTADSQLIYHDESSIDIRGSGFSEVGNPLRWANGLLGNYVNYTSVVRTESKITLQLSPGSYWRNDLENLPGTLTLLAINTGGAGFVDMNSTNADKGRDVATVFERPTVYSSATQLFRMHSHVVRVYGTGFPNQKSGFKPLLRFDPPLVEGTDYNIIVISHTELELTLVKGRAWRATAGALVVTHVNTRGDEVGWVKLPGDGVHIAEIKEDISAASAGGIEIFPMDVRVYLSALQQAITLTGAGFKEGISFELEPALQAGTDYTLTIDNEHQARLQLKSGRKWRTSAGLIIAKSVTIDGQSFKLGGDDGIRIAAVLEDPVVTQIMNDYHESQSKIITIKGSGFTTAADTTVLLRPTLPAAFKVVTVTDDQIRLQLQPTEAWLPAALSLQERPDEIKIRLAVSSINSGAGAILLDPPVFVGYIIKDKKNVVCDDSCEFAFDGVCDDDSKPKDYAGNRRLQSAADPNATAADAVDDYYMENEEYKVSACVAGTDCTDCGGVEAVIEQSEPLDPQSTANSCTNTCMYPRDGVCDDPRGTRYCALGSDCQDCGPVGKDNFTRSDAGEGWWGKDDDDYWNFNDGEAKRSNLKEPSTAPIAVPAAAAQSQSPAKQNMVYAGGATLAIAAAAAALYLLRCWYTTGKTVPSEPSVPFAQGSNAELRVDELDLPVAHMPSTPIRPYALYMPSESV